MSRNGSGVMVINSTGQPVSAGTLITAAVHNALTADLATALTNSIAVDGQSTITGNLPMAGFRHTGVGAAAGAGSYARVNEVQDGSLLYGGTAGGTADALTITTAPIFTAYATGMVLFFKSSASPNTGAATLQVNGIATPKAIQNNGSALTAGMIEASKFYLVIYDGAAFQIAKLVDVVGAFLPLTGGTLTGNLTINKDGPVVVLNATGSSRAEYFWQSGGATAWKHTNVADGGLNDLVIFRGAGAVENFRLVQATGNATFAGTLSAVNGGASETVAGAVELATQAETDAGTDDARIVTPLKLKTLKRITLATEQAWTSGTSKDFTGIPAGVRRITVMLAGVSTNGTSNLLIQIGDSGGIETTGYAALASNLATGVTPTNAFDATGFVVTGANATAATWSGAIILSLEDSTDFTWVAASNISTNPGGGVVAVGSGSKSLSAELDRVRVTTVNGTDAGDAGVINISYES